MVDRRIRLEKHAERAVTQPEIEQGLIHLGVRAGDTVFFHSSLSSVGYVINGADAVIDAFLAVVGPRGTVAVPTLVVEDRAGEYGTWFVRDTTPSNMGLITEVFRRRPDSFRSDDPIHSVAAIGARAEELTRGQITRHRIYPAPGGFSVGGPFDQLVAQNAKYVLLGTSFAVQTMCHEVEAIIAEQCLQRAQKEGDLLRLELESKLHQDFRGPGVWPWFDLVRMGELLLSSGIWKSGQIGEADAYVAETQPYVHEILRILQEEPEEWFDEEFLSWWAQVPGVRLRRTTTATAPRDTVPTPIGTTPIPRADSAEPPAKMVHIPGGRFIQGSAGTEPETRADEVPQRLVYLDPFYLDRYPVTNADYWEFVRATGHRTPPDWPKGEVPEGGESKPVIYVDWYDAAEYASWAGKRLPTEAEWEKAARGGLMLFGESDENPIPWRRFPWGDVPDPTKCATSEGGVFWPTPVGKYSPAGDSPYGVADMVSTLWEWTADWYDPSYYRTGPDQNPTGPTEGTERVLRGGAAYHLGPSAAVEKRQLAGTGNTLGRYGRSSWRQALQPQRLYANNSFRCAWSNG